MIKYRTLKKQISNALEEKVHQLHDPARSEGRECLRLFYMSFLDFKKSLATALGFPPVSTDFISFS